MADFLAGTTYTNGNHNDDGSSTHSRHSSISSDRSGSVQGHPDRASACVVKDTGTPAGHDVSDDSSDVSSQQLILRDGGLLAEESRTEITSGIFNQGFVNARYVIINWLYVSQHIQHQSIIVIIIAIIIMVVVVIIIIVLLLLL